MITQISKLFKDTVIYGISSIFGRFLNYLLVPLYTAIFAESEFGIVTEFYAYIAFLNILFTYGMETTYFHYSEKTSDKNRVYNLILSMILLSSVFSSALIATFSAKIAQILEYPSLTDIILYISIILFLDTFVAIPFARLRQRNQALKFASYRFSNILITLFLNIFFLYICPIVAQGKGFLFLETIVSSIYNPDKHVEYVFLSNMIANILYIPMLLKELFEFKFKIDWSIFKQYLRYAIPLLFMGLAGMINEVIDRILLRYLLPDNFYDGISSIGAVGVYGACYKLSIFMTLGVQAYRFAADPLFFSKAKDKDSKDFMAKSLFWFILTAVLVFIIVSVNLDWLKLVLRNPVYHKGLIVVPILLLANMFLGIYYNLSFWFKLTEKTVFGTYISFFGALITLLLNILLIPFFGFVGSAIATLVCYCSMAFLCFFLGQKHYPIPYDTKRISFYILYGVMAVSLSLFWKEYTLVLGNVFVLIFCLIVYFKEYKNHEVENS